MGHGSLGVTHDPLTHAVVLSFSLGKFTPMGSNVYFKIIQQKLYIDRNMCLC